MCWSMLLKNLAIFPCSSIDGIKILTEEYSSKEIFNNPSILAPDDMSFLSWFSTLFPFSSIDKKSELLERDEKQ